MTINLTTIKKSLQPDVISSFWTMLGELATVAENNDDRVLKHQVEGWHRQWNTITGDEKAPRWIVVERELTQPKVVRDTPNFDAVLDRVRKVVADQLGLPMTDVRNDISTPEMGADSLDDIEIIMALEDEFNIEIPDEDAESMANINEAAQYISDRVKV